MFRKPRSGREKTHVTSKIAKKDFLMVTVSISLDITQNQVQIQSHTFDSSTCVPYTHTRYSYMNGFSKEEKQSQSPFIHRRRLSIPNLPHKKENLVLANSAHHPGHVSIQFVSLFNAIKKNEKEEKKSSTQCLHFMTFPLVFF